MKAGRFTPLKPWSPGCKMGSRCLHRRPACGRSEATPRLLRVSLLLSFPGRRSSGWGECLHPDWASSAQPARPCPSRPLSQLTLPGPVSPSFALCTVLAFDLLSPSRPLPSIMSKARRDHQLSLEESLMLSASSRKEREVLSMAPRALPKVSLPPPAVPLPVRTHARTALVPLAALQTRRVFPAPGLCRGGPLCLCGHPILPCDPAQLSRPPETGPRLPRSALSAGSSSAPASPSAPAPVAALRRRPGLLRVLPLPGWTARGSAEGKPHVGGNKQKVFVARKTIA